MSDSYSSYVKELRAAIDAGALKSARAQIGRRRRKKAAKSVAKGVATVGGIGLGMAGIVLALKAGKSRETGIPSTPIGPVARR